MDAARETKGIGFLKAPCNAYNKFRHAYGCVATLEVMVAVCFPLLWDERT